MQIKNIQNDELLIIDDEVEFVIQINGKSRDKMIDAKNFSKEELEKKGLELVKDRIQVDKLKVIKKNFYKLCLLLLL